MNPGAERNRRVNIRCHYVIGRIKVYRLRSNQNVPPRRVRFRVLCLVVQVCNWVSDEHVGRVAFF